MGADNKIAARRNDAARSLIGVKEPLPEATRIEHLQGYAGRSRCPIDKSGSTTPARRQLDPISAVRMPERLTAAVDAWAEARHLSRSEAISKLVELGLKIAPVAPASTQSIVSGATRIEAIAVHEIEALLDPTLPVDERERRIRRLTEGPPEFSHQRIDLPKHRS